MTGEGAAGAPAGRVHPEGMADAGRCLVMGVLNVTPDSFSDGGAWFEANAAVSHGLALAAQGADIIDVGGESTRPGAQRVDQDEEMRRVAPAVAEVAVEAGARMINDVSGGLADPALPRLAAAAGVPYVIMHWRGHSRDMQEHAVYDDVVSEVRDELRKQVDAVMTAGVEPSRIIIDPGIGFAKLPGHNWALLRRLGDIAHIGEGPPFPLLVGTSRKSFLGTLLAGPAGEPRPVADRDDATIALSTLAATSGAWCVRVHAVAGNADAVRVAARWEQAGAG
jgi:dihydropteroate synthase